MSKVNMLKYIARNTDMNYIDGDYTIKEIFQLTNQSEKSGIELDFRFLWEWERSWNMFRRD